VTSTTKRGEQLLAMGQRTRVRIIEIATRAIAEDSEASLTQIARLAEVGQHTIVRPEDRVEVGGAKCHSDYVACFVKTIRLRELLGSIGEHCQRLKSSISEYDCAPKIERVRTGELCEKIAGVVEHPTCSDVSSDRHATSRQHDLRHRAASPDSWSAGKRRVSDALPHHCAVATNGSGPAYIRTRQESEIQDATSRRPQDSVCTGPPAVVTDDVTPFVNCLCVAAGKRVLRYQPWQRPDDPVFPNDRRVTPCRVLRLTHDNASVIALVCPGKVSAERA